MPSHFQSHTQTHQRCQLWIFKLETFCKHWQILHFPLLKIHGISDLLITRLCTSMHRHQQHPLVSFYGTASRFRPPPTFPTHPRSRDTGRDHSKGRRLPSTIAIQGRHHNNEGAQLPVSYTWYLCRRRLLRQRSWCKNVCTGCVR